MNMSFLFRFAALKFEHHSGQGLDRGRRSGRRLQVGGGVRGRRGLCGAEPLLCGHHPPGGHPGAYHTTVEMQCSFKGV